MERREVQGFIFRNLHHKGVVYSVRNSEGKTIAHSNSVLIRNAKFVVQPAGLARVRREKKKFVHAGVRGEVVLDPIEAANIIKNMDQSKTAYYNPYKTDHFVDVENNKLDKADYVLLTSDGDKSKVIYLAI
jgi:hypothetical protein